MNERIDQLLWAAGGYTKLNYPDDAFLDGRYALTQEQLDKFAQLIVLECSALVYNYPEKYLTRNQAREISMSMEEHFGIE